MTALSSYTILVVEDDPYILMSLEFLLKKNGFTVSVARNGTEALQLLKKQKPSLVLLDIMMPDVDGYEICRHIKATKSLAETLVVFMSAKTKGEDIQKGLDEGAACYIKKPFSTRDILKQIKSLLNID